MGSGVTYRPPDTHGYPGGVGVFFSNDPGQLRVGSGSVESTHFYKISPLPICLFFEVYHHDVSQKNTFLILKKYLKKELKVCNEKNEKCVIFVFSWFHIGGLCTKTLNKAS